MSKAAELANLIGNINMGGGSTNRNVIINGAMNVAQRSTSSTGLGATDGYFVCDRWHFNGDSSNAGRFTMTQDSSAPSGFANSLKLACTTADTSTAAGERLQIEHKFEGQNLQTFAKGTSDAKPFVLSFYVKANASATYAAELFDTANSRQMTQLFNVTTDWTRVELTYPADTTGTFADSNAEAMHLIFFLHAGSTYTGGTLNSSSFASAVNNQRAAGISSFFDSTDRTFFITGVQLEVGQNPTEFEHEPYERTLLKCQRYFYAVHQDYGPSSSNYSFMGSGIYYTSTNINAAVTFPVAMRAIPTATVNFGSSGNQGFISYTNNSLDYIGSSASINMPSIYGTFIQFGDGSGTGGHSGMVATQYDDQSFNFDAEL